MKNSSFLNWNNDKRTVIIGVIITTAIASVLAIFLGNSFIQRLIIAVPAGLISGLIASLVIRIILKH